MATVTGPRGKLFEDINARLKKPRIKKALPSRQRSTVAETPYDKYLMKGEDQYNCNDLEFLMRDEWKKKGWNTRPSSFAMKDRANAKRLLADQGGQNIAAMIKHVFKDWTRIQSQYRINGFPSMSLLYGFRGSWLPEALDGMSGPTKKLRGEYIEREAVPQKEEDSSRLNIKMPWEGKI